MWWYLTCVWVWWYLTCVVVFNSSHGHTGQVPRDEYDSRCEMFTSIKDLQLLVISRGTWCFPVQYTRTMSGSYVWFSLKNAVYSRTMSGKKQPRIILSEDEEEQRLPSVHKTLSKCASHTHIGGYALNSRHFPFSVCVELTGF